MNRCRAWVIGAVLVFAVSFVAGRAFAADDAGARTVAASDAGIPKTDAGMATKGDGGLGPVDPHAAMPTGHPSVDDDDGAGNPHGAGGNPHGAGGNPHGKGDPGSGMWEPPEDGAIEDAKIAPGSIEVLLSDVDSKPRAKTEVTLGIIVNSVAKGESRRRVTATTDESGVARFSGLETGSGVAYRVMVLEGGATFSAAPFQLGAKAGMKVLLHTYAVTADYELLDAASKAKRDPNKPVGASIVTQSMVYVEVKDDRVQVQQAFKIYNVGKVAWVPNDFVVPLPPEFTAFSAQQGMTDVGIDAVPKKGAKIRGTFAPGAHVIEFKWQLPYGGESDVGMDLGMTPNVAVAQIIAPAGKSMNLEVEGFPPPRTSNDGRGQRALVTERQMNAADPPVRNLHIAIKGLPTEGPAKIIATLLAGGTLAFGVLLGTRSRSPRDTRGERTQLLEDLADLERAHASGDVGPKTYARLRRELLDAIAKTFAADPKAAKKKKAA